MSTTTPTHENGSEVQTLDERDRRALTQYLTVLEDIGRAKDAADLFLVVSQSGKEYLVDRRERVCECPDYQYREVDGGCKHLRRVAFATGERAIPAGVDHDPQLGEHVTGGPRYTATDGGIETAATEAPLPDGDGEDRDGEDADAMGLPGEAHDTLATIVAQTTSTVADLPDWNVFNATCHETLATIERVVAEPTATGRRDEPRTDGGRDQDGNDDGDTETDRPALHVGDHVRDREADDADSVTMLVVGLDTLRADAYDLADGGPTVAAVNPTYPPTDDVVEVTFPQRTDVDVDRKRYAYPRSRLEVVARIHTRDAGGEGGEA